MFQTSKQWGCNDETRLNKKRQDGQVLREDTQYFLPGCAVICLSGRVIRTPSQAESSAGFE